MQEGFFEFVRPGESMEDKVMRQLHRAMQPALTDITVTWKGDAAKHVQPAPFRLPPLFCGGRLVVYGIIDHSEAQGEVEVVVQAKTVLKPFEAVVKVDLSKVTKGTLLNKLAARTLLKCASATHACCESKRKLTRCPMCAGISRRAGAMCTTARAG
jgi:hypothetical protein